MTGSHRAGHRAAHRADVERAEIAVFETERPRLRGLAYRMTGTPDDADDIVQEAWIRWQRADRSAIDNPAAWLTTVTSRLALDRLTSAQARREQYVGPWLPEPLATGAGPDELVAATDSLTLGFMRVLETLQPVERAVFLLHDVFELPFGEVAAAVDRNEPATRQIAKRARDRVRAGRPRLTAEPADVQALSEAFLTAMFEGDVDALAAMLTDDVVHLSDGGPDHHAARRPVRGPHRVARLFVNITRRNFLPTDEFHSVDVNGQTGTYVVRDGEPFVLTVLNWRGDRVAEALSIVNPDKLRHFHEAWLHSAP
jgi:RNA polymerase sigma-70 factor, ECF subfamily